MADNVEERPSHRGRWLGFAALLAIVAWIVRSRWAAAAAVDIGTGWPPPRSTGADTEYLRPVPAMQPQPPAAREGRPAAPASPGPAPAPVPPAPSSAASNNAAASGAAAARRPSPRPRTQAPQSVEG